MMTMTPELPFVPFPDSTPRYTRIYTDDGGLTWHVYNIDTDHPVWEDDSIAYRYYANLSNGTMLTVDPPSPRVYPTFDAARADAEKLERATHLMYGARRAKNDPETMARFILGL